MEEWFTAWKIPLGELIKNVVDWINANLSFVLNALSSTVRFVIDGTIDVLQWFPPLIIVIAIGALAHWMHRSWNLTIGTLLALLLIINQGYWEATTETLALIVFATLVSMAAGVPLGIAAAHRPWLWTAIRPILDLMQTIPTFVYLIPTLILFGLGVVPGLISTVIFAIPAPIRLTYLGIQAVPRPLIEAGESFGATKQQLLWKVEIPHAMPTIMAGLTQCIMLSLSMVVIAALVGANGLGKPVVRALNTVNVAQGFEAGLAIVIIAILLDRICKQPDVRGRK